jgi:ABC-2 type transport system permease protein
VIRLVRAEMLKVRSLWSTWVLVGAAALFSAAFGALVGFAPHNRRDLRSILFPPHGTPKWFDSLFSAMSLAQTLALVIGILAITTEYRHKTVTSTYLAEPRRGRVVESKLAVSAGWGAVTALSAGVACLALGYCVVWAGIGTSSTMRTEFGHVFPGVLLASMLFAVYGVGLGALLRNQVTALVVGLAFTQVLEPIIVFVLPTEGKYLPGQAAEALSSVTASARGGFGSSTIHLLPWWGGALVLTAYAVVLSVAGTFTTLRADVT